jgi:hypothetical protein
VTVARNEFDWIEYEVELPAPLARRLGNLITVPAREPGLAAAGEGPIEARVRIPDLSAHPTPRAKAAILLETAAEVEHALMVQYLYAGYSLKSDTEVADAGQKKVLSEKDRKGKSWPLTLRAIAREEMGHFMTVQNLLMFLAMPPNFEREDRPPRDDLYPFPLKLQPLTQKSLAKYVVAEAPGDAEGIEEINTLATEKAGRAINGVGILYALLGLVFARPDQIDPGATGDPNWDDVVRVIRDCANQQDPEPEHWHLPEDAFHPETQDRQAHPDDWSVGEPNHPGGQVQVDRVTDRQTALQAIRFIGEQGEGPTTGDLESHFARFLRIFSGDDQLQHPPFPAVDGSWVPSRDIPTNPKTSEPPEPDDDITHPGTRDWAKLADARYALILGLLSHYLFASGQLRQLFTGWIFAEMRCRLGYIARLLTEMPATADASSERKAAAPFTLPPQLTLPDDEAGRWSVHRDRTAEAIAIVERLRTAEPAGPRAEFLTDLLQSDQARLQLITAMQEHAQPTIPTSFTRDILPLFRPKDIDHMRNRAGDARIDLTGLRPSPTRRAFGHRWRGGSGRSG